MSASGGGLPQSVANVKRRSWSKSGIRGVYFSKRRGTWHWAAYWRGQRMFGSGFKTAEEAAKAREKAIKQAWPDRVAMTK